MRFRLRTLLIGAAVIPIIISAIVWICASPNPNIPRTPASKKATSDLRQLLLSATSLEVVEAGDAMHLRAKSFQGKPLKRLAEAVTIHDLYVTDVPETVVANAYIHFRLMKDDEVLQDYWFRYPDSLVDDSPKHNPGGHWTILNLSPRFAREFLSELTTPNVGSTTVSDL
jgi:hypothetical protein